MIVLANICSFAKFTLVSFISIGLAYTVWRQLDGQDLDCIFCLAHRQVWRSGVLTWI